SADDQQIALGGVYILVEEDAEGEENIVGVEWMAVREAQALPQSEGILKAVGGNLPGFDKSRLRELCGAIDVNEVGLHRTDDFARGTVGCDQRIQSFWFATERNDQASAGTADFSWQREQFFLGIRLLRVRECLDRQGIGWGASQEEAQGEAAAPERRAVFSHDKFQLVFSSILYGLARS